MARVTGIGGVFFKARDPEGLKRWYADHLGVEITEWGCAIFEWPKDQAEAADEGVTVWQIADASGDWFEPSRAQVMINYRVDDLTELLAQLAEAGIRPIKGPDTEFNGLFAWVMDPEGNKVELWEPRVG